jgi:cytochrome c-type biogenesis protein CcmH
LNSKVGLIRLSIAAVLALTLGASTIAAFGSSSTTSLQEVSEQLTCQCGCGLTVANCNHPQCEFSVPVRQQIEGMIGKGMTRIQIVAFFRQKYGEKILSAPTTEGFNLLAWIMPFAAVFAGCFIIVGAISRWRSRDSSAPAAVPDEPAYDPELRRRLENDIRERQ